MSKRAKQAGDTGGEMVTAHEIGCFVYCPEQWRLQYGLGLSPQNQESLAHGRRFHAHTSLADMIAGWAIRLGMFVLAAAFLFVLVVVWQRWR
jgi:hypothetical protein